MGKQAVQVHPWRSAAVPNSTYLHRWHRQWMSKEWSVTMKGSIIKDYSAYKITTGSETQDLALVFGEGVTDEKYVDFKVSWVKQATLEIVKKGP